jgi:hypothetical protein
MNGLSYYVGVLGSELCLAKRMSGSISRDGVFGCNEQS